MIDRPARSDAAELTDEQLLEKLSGFGVHADRADIARLCEGALSVEEVAQPLLERCGVGAGAGQPNPDWIWLCLLELWRRWWPERVCVEFLGDKIQEGYDALERRETVPAAATWLDAWSDVVRLCDLSGIDSIREFDDRFSMYQSLFQLGARTWRTRWGTPGARIQSSCARGSRCARRRCGGFPTRTS